MRESIANSYIFTLVIIFVGIIIVLLISSISMSKIFKVRNRVVDIIETHEGYNENVQQEIEEVLTEAGYTLTIDKSNFTDACKKFTANETGTLVNLNDWNGHTYCVYEHRVDRGVYYTVYVRLEYSIPIIGAMAPISSKGDTRIISNLF